MAIGPTSRAAEKNIWIAAGDGDLDRVRELIEHQGLAPNAPDPFTYTPMHAAASYGHVSVLEYLVAHGGDVNVTDEDGDTPLYTVETIDTARWLVEHGAIITRTNHEGISPAEHLSEDFPEIADYLRALTTTVASTISSTPAVATSSAQTSRYAEDRASNQLTDSLMANAGEIIRQAEADGRDPDEELRRLVGDTVLQGVMTGYGMSEDASTSDVRDGGAEDVNGVKRQRRDENS